MKMIFIGEWWLTSINLSTTFNNNFFALGIESLDLKGFLTVSIKRLIEGKKAGIGSIYDIP
jgi:hypothetical protein